MSSVFEPVRCVSSRGCKGGVPAFESYKVVLSVSDVEQLLPQISSALQVTAPHDYAVLVFRDERAAGRLRFRQLSPQHEWRFVEQAAAQLNKKSIAPTLTLRRFAQPVYYDHPEIKFGYWIPLIRRGEAVGALFVGSRHDERLKQRVSDLLTVSPQGAGALEVKEDPHLAADLRRKLREEKSYFEEQLRAEWRFENVIGVSNGFKAAMDRARMVAAGQETGLITGEFGTEKELMARLIHQLGPRNRQIFVKLNCAGYPSHILARKLFGYEKIDLCGVPRRRPGRLELAHLGTLFLDDVADLSIELQSALLLAIEERGRAHSAGKRRVLFDFHLLASTSCDLPAMVKSGRFNKDLYDLLAVFPIALMPLRERPEDIPLLVEHLVCRFSRQMRKTIRTIPKATMTALCSSPWPGNSKELENFVERAVMLTSGSTLNAPLEELEPLDDESLEAAERRHILRILKESGGVIGGRGGAADRLRVKRTTLNSKLKKLQIQKQARV